MATQESDLFESLLFVEEANSRKGQKDGEKASLQKNFVEGFSLGLVKGYEVGCEVTFYHIFAKTWLELVPKDSKEAKILVQLMKLAEEYPRYNVKDESESKSKQALNAKFKQVSESQCGNCRIFLSLRFCVKSTLGILEVKTSILHI